MNDIYVKDVNNKVINYLSIRKSINKENDYREYIYNYY